MMRKRVTLTMWLGYCGVHAAFVSLLGAAVVVLDVKDIVNLLEYATGTILFLLIGTPVFGAIWAKTYVEYSNSRIPAHCCKTCGYDLTGNVSGVCPECGTAVKAS